MPDEALDPILLQITVPLPIPMIYAALTSAEQLPGWLSHSARISPQVGGDYVLVFQEPVAFESAGKVQRLTQDVDIGFTWFAPPPFGPLMNEGPSPTNVYLRLQESPEGVDITLEHAGWGSGEEWEEARSWHFHFWDDRLQRLKDYLIKTAYG